MKVRVKLREMVLRPRLRALVGVAVALLLLWAVAGFLVLPHFLRPLVERRLAQFLHRPVALRALKINPFALSATLEGLDVKDRGGAGPFFSLERLYVNVEAVSLFRGGPVIRAITLTNPAVTVVRNEDGTYNFQDLLDEASKPKPAEPERKGGELRFSVNNIRVEGGRVDFDDRPKRTKHTVRDMRIGIPFLSNIPSRVEITTRPVFEAKVNGAPFSLHGSTKPFSQSRETTVELEVSDVDLPYYLSYLPASVPSKLTAGRLDAKLTIAFQQALKGSSALVLSGRSALRNLSVESGGKPLLACDRFEAVLGAFEVFGRKVHVTSLKAVAPEIWVRRERTGGYNVASALGAPASSEKSVEAQAPKTREAAGPPWLVEVAEAGIEGGKIHYEDLALVRPFRALLTDVALSAKHISTAPGQAATLEASAKTDAGEALKHSGTFSLDPLVLEGSLEIAGLPIKRYAPYFERLVTFDVDDGMLDLATKYRFSTGPDANTTVSELTASLKSPRLRKRGEKEPFFRSPLVKLTKTAVDLGRREVVLGDVVTSDGLLAVVRGKDGNADLATLVAEPPSAPAPAAAAAPASAPAPPPAPWSISLGKLALDGYTLRIQDDAMERPARYALTRVGLLLENVSTAGGKKGTLSVRFGINGKGMASAKGPVGIHPTYADLKADVKGLDLVPLEPYVLSNLRLSLARGTLSAAGRLSLREAPQGKTALVFAGKAQVANMLALDQDTKLDFFKWDTFSLEGMKAGYSPTFLEVSRLSLAGMACDIEVEPDGTVNLSKVVGKPVPPEQEETETPEPAPAASTLAPAAAATPAPGPPDEKVPIRIGTLLLESSRIHLADHFIKPSYSATLGDLSGQMSGLSTDQGTVAELHLTGSLANHSPLEISGKVNPLAATAFADVKASFRDIDLPPFTAYSGKYAGYAIARGTLTMEVSYKLQNRKLAAENRFLIDQFEFGDKVESKDATKLPVRFAVSLLRDKNGLIDLDLPIEGSLDDPKFRLGKVIWKVIGNLIGKAATAPFALLGRVFGGKGEELSSIDFADGRDVLDDAAIKKLDALAKALTDRPGLKLEAKGCYSGDKDAEGLRHLRLERKIKAQKLADLVKKGEAPASVDAVVVDEKEYPTYLTKAYKKEKFKKPRNVIGVAKDLPVPEMESLMLANLAVTADDLRQLALARANAVKDRLTGPGKVEAARIFILEPDAKAAAQTEKARASRVDFVLK